MNDKPSFFDELKRRDVIRVAGLYLVGAWLLIQSRARCYRPPKSSAPFRLHDPFLPDIGIDENLAPIKDDPRFRDVLKRLKLDVYFTEPERK